MEKNENEIERLKSLGILITTSKDIIESKLKNVTNFCVQHKEVGNPNFWEITELVLARNVLKTVEIELPEYAAYKFNLYGPYAEKTYTTYTTDEMVQMILDSKKDCIADYFTFVPETMGLYEAAVNGSLVPTTASEFSLVQKCMSVSFYVYNTIRRGDCDITTDKETNRAMAEPNYLYDNENESKDMVSWYRGASDELKALAAPVFQYLKEHSVPTVQSYFDSVLSEEKESDNGYGGKR